MMRDDPPGHSAEDDEVVTAFLDFLERDIEQHPKRLVPVTPEFVHRLRSLAGDLDVDPYAPIEGPVDL